MFAVISSGGKQYKVSQDTILTVNKVAGEAGDKVTVEDVLFASDGKEFTVGDPIIKGAKVSLEIIKQDRDRKILVFKKKRRKNYRRKNGHRQDMTFLQVKSLSIPGLKIAVDNKKEEIVKEASSEKTSKEKVTKKNIVKKVAKKKSTKLSKDK